MLIVLNGMLKYIDLIDKLDVNKLYITMHEIRDVSGKQIVVSDLGYGIEYAEQARDFYPVSRLADKYLYGIRLYGEDKLTIMMNGANIFDIAFSVKILSNLSTYKEIPRITLLIEAPKPNMDNYVKARFYAFLKLIGFYDILFNHIGEGVYTYTLIDPDQPMQLYSYLASFIEQYNGLTNCFSLTHISLKRFIIPLLDLSVVSEVIALLGKAKSVAEEYKTLLLLMHRILDNAPTDLWSIARRKNELIRGSFYSYRELARRKERLREKVSELIKLISRGTNYTVPIIDPRAVFEKLSSGKTLSKIYSEISIKELYEKVRNIDAESLNNTYTLGSYNDYSYSRRVILVGEDVSKALGIEGEDEIVILKGRVNEITTVHVLGLALNMDCGYNTDYIPVNLYESYIDSYGLSKNLLYPPTPSFKNYTIEVDNIHNMNIVNYLGYVRSVSEKCVFIGKNTVEEFIKKI